MDNAKKLGQRATRALAVFETREIVHWCDLPMGVSYVTMAQLVNDGLIEIVNPKIGRDSKSYAWRRKNPKAQIS